jgi:hypothetical protein
MRSLSCSRRSTIALPISFVFVWVVVSDNSLSAWLANAAPENAPSLPLVHDPFNRKTAFGLIPAPKVVGQNIVCARTSAGYPIANKPMMPEDTARMENLGTVRRMACLPALRQATLYLIFSNVWLYSYNTSRKID